MSRALRALVLLTLIFGGYAAHEGWEASRYGGPYDSAWEALAILAVCVAMLASIVWFQRRAGHYDGRS
jgi:hypothetical protein